MELQPNPTRVYSNTTARDHARVHLGDIYNYTDAALQEKRIIDWLTPLNPSQSHHQACKQHQDGTLSWFFANSHFQHWRDGPEVALPLWCRGHAGTGKTTLVAQIVRHLQMSGVARGQIAVVYSRYAETKIQTAEAMLGSILAQLFQKDDDGLDVPKEIVEQARNQSIFRQSGPTLETLETWLRRRLQVGPRVFVILDAADEMEPQARRVLLGVLQGSHQTLNLLITSRVIPDIGHDLGENEEIEIQADTMDLQTVVLAKLTQKSSDGFKRLIFAPNDRNPAFETAAEEILLKIVRSAGDMFLLASLHTDRILECNYLHEIHHYLDNVPSGIDELYDEAWKRAIGDSTSHKAKLAREVILWTFIGRLELTVGALGETLLASGFGNGRDHLTEQEILSPCAGLIRTESPATRAPYCDDDDVEERAEAISADTLDKIVTLSHPSVHRYLQTRRELLFPHADDVFVSRCLPTMTSSEISHAVLVLHFITWGLPLIIFCLYANVFLIIRTYDTDPSFEVFQIMVLILADLCASIPIILLFFGVLGVVDHWGQGSGRTASSFGEYKRRRFEDHVAGARWRSVAPVYQAMVSGLRFQIRCWAIWIPFIALVARLATGETSYKAADYVRATCQLGYFFAFLVLLVTHRRLGISGRTIDLCCTIFGCCSGLTFEIVLMMLTLTTGPWTGIHFPLWVALGTVSSGTLCLSLFLYTVGW